tara:strand:+ start:56 stop:190 length:135 start_codon:yes stop_codon:yes gene_type:complete
MNVKELLKITTEPLNVSKFNAVIKPKNTGKYTGLIIESLNNKNR